MHIRLTIPLGLLLVGAWLRLRGIGVDLRFGGDQGEFYLAIMRWFDLGEWPLLGQTRSKTMDHALGPGFYYVIAPLVGLSRYHPAAGAVTVTMFNLAGAWLAYRWVLRTSRHWPAAVVVLAGLLLAPEWIARDRELWSPNLLPFATLLIVYALEALPRRPLACILALVTILAILPQWHTIGFLIAGVAMPFVVWRLWNARGRIRRAWRLHRGLCWLAAGIAAAGVVALYLPPLIHEARYPGTIAAFFANTVGSAPPSRFGWLSRLFVVVDYFNRLMFEQAFGWPGRDFDRGRWAVNLLALALVGGALVVAPRSRRARLSVGFVASLFVISGAAAFRQGEYFEPYYLVGLYPLPLVTIGWAAGTALDRSRGARPRLVRVVAMGALLGCSASIALQGWRAMNAPPRFADAHGSTLKTVNWIAERTQGGKYSLVLIERHNFRAHYHALLWRKGSPPLNADMRRLSIPADELGDWAMIVVRGEAARYANDFADFTRMLKSPVERARTSADTTVFCVPTVALPDSTGALEVEIDDARRRFSIRPRVADSGE